MTNKFNDIINPELRIWNRCAIIFNLMKDKGSESVSKYVSGFTEVERKELTDMFGRIKRDGYETTRAAINRNVQSATLVA